MSLLKWLFGKKEHISEDTIKHSSIGTFNKVGRMMSGGHSQRNIDLLKKNKIDYKIEKTYSNGVRIGSVPNHKEPKKKKGINQSWFPKNWNDNTIIRAGQVVARGSVMDDGVAKIGHYRNVQVGIIRTKGKIATIFPTNIQKDRKGRVLNECRKNERISRRK